MRLSDRYIGRQVLVGTLFAILLLSTILVMGSLFQNLRMLIVDLGAPLSIIGEFLVAALPFALIYTIPWAFLCAVLLVFGRMSSENELIGLRVAGMSLGRISLPVFTLGALLSAACLWLNLEVAPWAKHTSRTIRTRAFAMDPRSVLSAAAERDGLARFEESLKNVRAYIEKSDGSTMEGFHIFRTAEEGEEQGTDIYLHAMKAEAVIDKEAQQFRLHLYDAMFVTQDSEGLPKVMQADESVPVVLPYETRPPKDDPAAMSIPDIRAQIAKLKQDDIDALAEGKRAWRQAIIPNYEIEIHRRFSSSLACLAFAFIGVPLGIKARRKDTSSGLVLSLLIGAAYFICGMFSGKSTASMLLAAWGPNVVCVIIGLILLRRARFR